jgi:hypothetical protein
MPGPPAGDEAFTAHAQLTPRLAPMRDAIFSDGDGRAQHPSKLIRIRRSWPDSSATGVGIHPARRGGHRRCASRSSASQNRHLARPLQVDSGWKTSSNSPRSTARRNPCSVENRSEATAPAGRGCTAPAAPAPAHLALNSAPHRRARSSDSASLRHAPDGRPPRLLMSDQQGRDRPGAPAAGNRAPGRRPNSSSVGMSAACTTIGEFTSAVETRRQSAAPGLAPRGARRSPPARVSAETMAAAIIDVH